MAEGDAEMADAAVHVMREPVVAATLSANARQLVERRYTWAAVARSWESLWLRTADIPASAIAA
jgi:glycosyltransferase involved in cell wall biosynthesis